MCAASVTVDVIWKLDDEMLINIIGFNKLEKLMYENARERASKYASHGTSNFFDLASFVIIFLSWHILIAFH